MTDPLTAGFIVVELLIFLGVCAWYFVRLGNIERRFGSFDIYWQIFFRAVPLQAAALLLYLLARQFI